jgi:hypothetical protein
MTTTIAAGESGATWLLFNQVTKVETVITSPLLDVISPHPARTF